MKSRRPTRTAKAVVCAIVLATPTLWAALPFVDGSGATGALSANWTQATAYNVEQCANEFCFANKSGNPHLAFVNSETFDDEHYWQGKLLLEDASSGAQIYFCVRCSGTGGSSQGYVVTKTATANHFRLYKRTGGALGSPISETTMCANAANDTIRVWATGSATTTIHLSIGANEGALSECSDAAYFPYADSSSPITTAGACGMGGDEYTSGNVLDDVKCDDVAGGAAATPPSLTLLGVR